MKTAFRGLKTWLGLRYDRPAVPDEYIDLAKRLAEEFERHRPKDHTDVVRDVLVQFIPGNPPRYRLFAIILDASDRSPVRLWLAEVGRNVPEILGIATGIDAATAAETSLDLIEDSYAVDLSQITWGGKSLRGAPGRLSQP